ncbi:MAG: lysophospholipid acyltransferase family protein [Acidobacteria bacterium]|nr:lysophospholipid acyltransferase family protein [Acidobacteriota bacterium]
MSAQVEIAGRGRPLGSPVSVWLHFRLVPLLGAQIVKLLGHTLRVKTENFEAVDALVAGGERIILAFWHRRLLMMPLSYPWARRAPDGSPRGVAILSSDSRDGERSAATWRWFGIHAVRGTASDDGAKALVRMIRAVREGWDFGITPDGPKGPALQLKPGVLALARKTGAWIVPVTVAMPRGWTLRTWDRMRIPSPFSEVTVRYGEPWRPGPGGEEAEDARRLQVEMDVLEAWAESSG